MLCLRLFAKPNSTDCVLLFSPLNPLKSRAVHFCTFLSSFFSLKRLYSWGYIEVNLSPLSFEPIHIRNTGGGKSSLDVQLSINLVETEPPQLFSSINLKFIVQSFYTTRWKVFKYEFLSSFVSET